MCLLMTLAAALAVSLLWYYKNKKWGEDMKLAILALMYWSAALMWTVDGFFRLADGEPFLEFSRDDAWLGLLAVASGLAVYLVLKFSPFFLREKGRE
jgi:hypothetical protein